MGYHTQFKGKLKFTKELSGRELAKVKTFLGEDCRQHPEWGRPDLFYVDLKFLDDFSGLTWDEESESTYEIIEVINLIITEMKKDFPDFGLTGRMLAQGDDIEDRWWLAIENGRAVKINIETIITCPHCKHQFNIEKP